MIHIHRTAKPAELTDELCARLTAEYKENKKIVWNKPFIRNNLLQMSHFKCCYCEKRIGPGEPDMHVDHFKPKSLYPEEVVEWTNLNPSCPDCNRSKSEHDTIREPIVNPCTEDPHEYFYLKSYRYKPIDTAPNSKARITIDILGLNETDKKCIPRYQMSNEILQILEQINLKAKECRTEIRTDVRIRNRITKACRDILKMCCPDAEYSAFTATDVHTDADYNELKTILQEENCWDEELEALDQLSKTCVFNDTDTI